MNFHNSELNSIPRIAFANLPTPLDKLNNFIGQYSNAVIYMKRDDLTGQCFGGNKERKLEYIMADALQNKATVLVTVGVLQSNHCRLVTAISNKLGLRSELILINNNETEEIINEGNFFLNNLMGAKIHIVRIDEVQDKIKNVLQNLRDNGEQPYFIEGGGHNVFGAIGYVFALRELKKQIEEMGLLVSYLVLPTGTCTTQAGLILGKRLFGLDIEIIGISIARNKNRCVTDIETIIKKTEVYLNLESTGYVTDIIVYDEYIGKRYGIPTKEGLDLLRVMAEKEGLIIDPIYNAKALAGMFDLISKGVLKGNIIYLNTGGLPALFTKNILSNFEIESHCKSFEESRPY